MPDPGLADDVDLAAVTAAGSGVVVRCDSPECTRRLARGVGERLDGGDVVVLTGALGAGKTTFVQGLARGLGVLGRVTSPTFVLAREHRSDPAGSRPDGPDLVHVDAYRLSGVAEVDDLDLDSDLARAVVVVEWGEGLAERLSPRRLEVRIDRDATGPDPTHPDATHPDETDGDGTDGDGTDGDGTDGEARTIMLRLVGHHPRLDGAALAAVAAAAGRGRPC